MARDFLGIGWKFPLQVTPAGRITQARYEQRIEESVLLILSTAKGERVMLPDFGCGIHDLTFSPNTPGARSAVVDAVRKSTRLNSSHVRISYAVFCLKKK